MFFKMTRKDFEEFVYVALLSSIPTMFLLVSGVVLANNKNSILVNIGILVVVLFFYFYLCVLTALKFIVLKHYDKFKPVFKDIIETREEDNDDGDDFEEHF